MFTGEKNIRIVGVAPYALYRLDEDCPSVSIIEGQAWITAGGRDIIASAGQTISLDGSSSPVLISGLLGRGVTLHIEVAAQSRSSSSDRDEKQAAYAPAKPRG